MIEKKMNAGESFVLPFRVKRRDGSYVDITGIAAKIQLRDKSTNGFVLHEWDDDSPEVTRDDVNGSVILTLPPSFTNDQNFKEAYTDLLLLTDPKGMRSAVVKILFHRGVTR